MGYLILHRRICRIEFSVTCSGCRHYSNMKKPKQNKSIETKVRPLTQQQLSNVIGGGSGGEQEPFYT